MRREGQQHAPRVMNAVVRNAAELDRVRVHLRPGVRRQCVGQHAERATLLHGFAKQCTHARVTQNDPARDLRLLEVLRSTRAHVHQIRIDTALRRGPGVDRDHVAIAGEAQQWLALSDNAQLAIHWFPGRQRQRPALDAIGETRRREGRIVPHESGAVQDRSDARNAGIEAVVAGQPEILLDECHRAACPLTREVLRSQILQPGQGRGLRRTARRGCRHPCGARAAC